MGSSYWQGSGVDAREYHTEFNCPSCNRLITEEWSSDNGAEWSSNVVCKTCATVFWVQVNENASATTYLLEGGE